MAIDPKLLPQRFAVDTTVLIASKKPNEQHHQVCLDLLNVAMAEKRELLITAITYGEFVKSPGAAIPRVEGLEIVAFDQRAAEEAQNIPPEVWKKEGDRQIAKVDALIAACAKRHGATLLVTLDERQARIAHAIGLHCNHPTQLETAQGNLFPAPQPRPPGVPPPPPGATK